MITPNLYDTVELLFNLPDYGLVSGERGAIVHQHSEDVFEVEFANQRGETEQLCALNRRQFMVVWQAATETDVSLADQIAQLAHYLPEQPQRQLFNFAYTLTTHG